ncbi:MAG: (E)-4-hydroxy-3-methylbut-2-enyl-diphosphate synthase [Treponema sp.]|nr:(E)-4-hydroxy-3-methylbut-2-enyl-diphosphate synthase [Treponema sp.]
MEKYKTTRQVILGGHDGIKKLVIGGTSPVTLQTMWKEPVTDVTEGSERLEETLKKLNTLKTLGCDIVRFAVPDTESARALRIIQSYTDVPLVADIHFDWRLALSCLDENLPGCAVSAIRINPGNIGSRQRVQAVVDACRNYNAAIRIGVNSGSLPKELAAAVENGTLDRAEALSRAALREAEVLDEMNFSSVVVSMKSSDVKETIRANEAFALQSDIPLHVGVTEAGPLITGVVKSTLAFSHLLKEGIGATIRVSLSDSPENEIIAGREILHECGLRKGGVTLVSCPRCGRIGFDVHSFVSRWQKKLLSMDKDITVAVMGCVVNGPGEGKHADIGIAGGDGRCIIFRKGQIVRTIDEKDADKAFEEELVLIS